MTHLRTSLSVLAVCMACAATPAQADLMYVSYTNGASTIVTYDTTSANPTPTTFATGVAGAGYIATDSTGNLIAGDYTSPNGAIEKFTPAGVGSVFTTGTDFARRT